MANKTTANAFMASAQKSKREMADIQKEGSGKHETDEVELKKISLLIPAWLHKQAQLHREVYRADAGDAKAHRREQCHRVCGISELVR